MTVGPIARGGDHWPQWRGPDGNGVSDSVHLPTTWSESHNIKWKVPLPSWGGATPIVWGDRVLVMSPSKRVQGQPDTAVARKFPFGGRQHPGGSDLLLMCFSRKDGTLLWKRVLSNDNKLYGKQNMASPSPVTDGKHIWAMTGTGVLTCLDMDGNQIWQRKLQDDFGAFGLYWGYASSPLLYDHKIIVEVLHGATSDEPSYVVAFDTSTGKNIWKVERPTDAPRESPDAYTTPTLLRIGKRREIVITGADYVTGHDPGTGEELWRRGGLNPEKIGNYRIVASPVVVDGMIFAASRVRPFLAFKAGSTKSPTAPELAWKFTGKGAPDVPTPVCDGKYLYWLNDRGLATCLDARSGKVIWGPERTAAGTCSASPLLADGKLYLTNETATTTVLAAGAHFKLLATNKLDDGYTIASMAVAGSSILLRTSSHLYCIEEEH